MGLYHLLAAD